MFFTSLKIVHDLWPSNAMIRGFILIRGHKADDVMLASASLGSKMLPCCINFIFSF